MTVMIKLKLPHAPASLDEVRRMPGLKGLQLDERFGVVCVSPKDSLYVVRAEAVDNLAGRKSLSPEIIEAYGDIHIGPV